MVLSELSVPERPDDVVRRITLAPDPALVNSLGTHHTVESAMADLVDNSIDAGATEVTIRLLVDGSRLTGIVVVDDGSGMDNATIDRAMRLGGRRDYAPGDLGHFGVGLQAAALGNADVLTVWSRQYGATPVGRRLRRVDMQRDYSCEVLSVEAAERATDFALPDATHGTVVALSEIKAGVHGLSDGEARIWLANTESAIRQHLGLVFHRLIASHRIKISVVQLRADGRLGSPAPVTPIDPFGYPMTGRPGFPRKLTAVAAGSPVEMTCHIWPPRYDNNPEFRLHQKPGDEAQGFYVYRADRLLQIGGWNGVTASGPSRRLARVAIDVDGLDELVELNPEKSGTTFVPTFARALSAAAAGDADDKVTFADFLAAAEDTHITSKKRHHKRERVVQPAQGLSPEVRKAIKNELEFRAEDEPVSIKWRRMPLGRFFEIDRAGQTLWLNAGYRDLFTPGRKAVNDAPLLKTLMYLLTQDHFSGVLYSNAKRDDAALWQVLLGTAAEEEAARQRHAKEDL